MPHEDTRQHAVIQTDSRNARYGLILFFAYLILYATFVYLSAFRADVMASRPFGGVNLAVIYGLGLIVAAILFAFVYMILCRDSSRDHVETRDESGAAR